MTAAPSMLGHYLRARRALVQPEDVGIEREPNRRVTGLRREEIAELAGISPDYYLRLEQGHDHQPSDQVLRSLGRALALDDDALVYLNRLGRPDASRSRRRVVDITRDASITTLLAQWSHTPAHIIDRNQDIVLSNPMAIALGGRHLDAGGNVILTVFEPDLRHVAPDWEKLAADCVAALRFHGDPDDPRLREIVGSLSLRFREFRELWARHDARPFSSGRSRSRIDGVGLVDLCFQNFAVPGDSGHSLTTFFAEPGTPGIAAMAYLAATVEASTATSTHTNAPERQPGAGVRESTSDL
jgi:transcriptional regulator with XRE-family HTH domain